MNNKTYISIAGLLIIGFLTSAVFAQDNPILYNFSGQNVEENGLTVMGAGFGSMPQASISFGAVPTDNQFPNATDGVGAIIEAQPGESLLILFPIIPSTQAAMLRCSVRTTLANASVYLASIDQSENTFVSTITPNNGGYFLNRYRRLADFVLPPSSVGFQPLLQVVNTSQTEKLTVFLDNFEVYLLQKGRFYSEEFLNGDDVEADEISVVKPENPPTPTPTMSVNPLTGTWTGLFEATFRQEGHLPKGHLIFDIQQNGQTIKMTSKTDQMVFEGTLIGDRLLASARDEDNELVSLSATNYGNTIGGEYTSSNEKGVFTLSRAEGRADIGGIWLLYWNDENATPGRPERGFEIYNIDQSGNQLIMTNLLDGFRREGVVEGDTFYIFPDLTKEDNEDYFSGTFFNNSLQGQYSLDLNEWGGNVQFDGRFSGVKYDGGDADLNGVGNITINQSYPTADSKNRQFTIEQNVHQIRLSHPLETGGFEYYDGVAYGPHFIAQGQSSDGYTLRVEGHYDSGSIQGSVSSHKLNDAWWGYYTGTLSKEASTPTPTATEIPTSTPTLPPNVTPTPVDHTLSGVWVGTNQDTYSNDGVLSRGYLILDVTQNGQSIQISSRTDSTVLEGTFVNKQLNASGSNSEGKPFSIAGTYNGTSIAGTFQGQSSKGNFTVSRAGTRANGAGVWIVAGKDEYDSHGMPTNNSTIIEIQQTEGQLLLTDKSSGDQKTGIIEGNTFYFFPTEQNSYILSGTINSNKIEGVFVSDHEDSWSWGTFSGNKYDGKTLSIPKGTKFTLSITTIYPEKEAAISRQVTMTQDNHKLQIAAPNGKGGTDYWNGLIYGSTFVVSGTSADGYSMRIDGTITGKTVKGTAEGEDSEEWWWETYTGTTTATISLIVMK